MHVRAHGQPNREYRALARFARHRYVAAHLARELASDGKAKPGPTIAPRGQGIGLGEILKQFCLLTAHRGVSIYDEEFVTRHFNMMRIMARSDSLNDMTAGLRPRLSAPAA